MTSNEQKQQFSVAFVHAIAARAGFACQVKIPDEDSVDVTISATGRIHEQSIVRSPRLDLQLKATASPKLTDAHLSFHLSKKNYEDLRADSMVPRLLVVVALPESIAAWLNANEERMILKRCAYWTSLQGMPESSNTVSVTIKLPRSRRFDVDQLVDLMRRVSRKEAL